MVLELNIENVGGLKGTHQYRFKKGSLNVIEGDNANGKSSVVKSLVAVLSVSNNFDIIKNEEEARKLGIISEERNPRAGFVNIHSTYAKVELKGETISESFEINRDGKVKKLPVNGDLNFLYAGILSKDCRIFRDLREGISDFGWIVSKLSNAKYYDDSKKIIDEKITEFGDTAFKLNEKAKLLSYLKKDKEKIEQKLLALIEERSKISETSEKSEKYNQKFIERNKTAKEKDEQETKINNYNREIRNLTKEISEIESNKIKLEKEIEKINTSLKEIKNELQLDNTSRISEIDKRVTELIGKRGEVDGKINIYLPTEQALSKSNKQTEVCPVCETGKIDQKKVKSKLNALYAEKEEITKKILTLSTEKNRYRDRIEELKAQLNETAGDLGEKKHSLYELEQKGKIDVLKSRRDGYVRDLGKHKTKLKEIEQKLNNLDREIKDVDKNSAAILAKVKKLDEEIGGGNERIRQIDEELLSSNIVINDEHVDIDRALKVYASWLSALSKVQTYLKDKADIQRQKARIQFNENIGRMMDNLNFKDLKNIKLNNENKLFVERIDEKTKQMLMQDVKTLATSEKLTIAILLQIALKETYIQTIPFLILDDIEDFDESRREKIFTYLSDEAKKKEWYVIATRLVENRKGLIVKQFEQGA